jgi:EXLDI family protein
MTVRTEDIITTKSWVVRDEERDVRFVGVLLASTSSRRDGKRRWSEVDIYRTEGGNYVVARCGRSSIEGERDFPHAQVCETAKAVIETLYAQDAQGAWYFTHLAREAITKAGEQDEEIAAAFRTEYVD